MTKEDFDGRKMIMHPLVGLLFGKPIMICAFWAKESDWEAALKAQEEFPEEVKADITLDRYVPIDNWWDEVIEAAWADNHKG